MVSELSLSTTGIGVREAIKGFLLHMRAGASAKGYIDALRMSLTFLADYAMEHDWPELDGVTASHLDEYFAYFNERPLWFGANSVAGRTQPSSSYLDAQWRRINRFFRWLEERSLVETNPMTLVARVHVEQKLVPTVPERDVSAILAHLDRRSAKTGAQRLRTTRDRAMLLLLWDSPGRRAELSGLRMTDVDLDDQTIKVTGKRAKERQMPIGSVATEALWEYLQERRRVALGHVADLWVDSRGNGLSRPGWLYLRLKRLAATAGVPGLWTHRFRHSYAVNALRGGMPTPVLEFTGGWKKIPETYLRTLGMEDAKRFHELVSPADHLVRNRRRKERKSLG